jgi:hypothetical protein
MQDTIQEHKKVEKRDMHRLKRLFNSNPYMTLKDPLTPSNLENPPENEAPIYHSDDENAPSPRQSEYITHPSLSQALRK